MGAQANPAPLFHSVADYLPDDPEHEQEVQDFYALKSSRRHFGAYTLASNTTVGEEDEDGDYSEDSTQELRQSRAKGKGGLLGPGGIRSSWRASAGSSLVRSTSQTSSVLSAGTERADGKGKDRMVEIGLDDSVRLGMMPEDIDTEDMVRSPRELRGFEGHRLLTEDDDDDDRNPPNDIAIEMPVEEEEEPPAFQQFRRPPPQASAALPFAAPAKPDTSFMPRLSSPGQRGPHMSIVRIPSFPQTIKQ
jgi:hypothetical protein